MTDSPDFREMVNRLLHSRSWPYGVMPFVAIAEYAYNLGRASAPYVLRDMSESDEADQDWLAAHVPEGEQ